MPKLATDKVALTKPFIEALQPRPTSYLVHDAAQRGLCIKVRPTGSKTFLVYRSVGGRPTKVTIGRWPEWNVVAARAHAAKIVSDLVHGTRPKQVKSTLGEVAELYTQHLIAQGRRHPDYVMDTVKASWSALQDRKLDTISAVEIAETHTRIAASRGKVAGARAVKVLRTIYAYAVDLEITERNPAKRVRVQDSKTRDVFLNTDELTVFHRALATMCQDARDYFGLLLLTGQRRSNVAGMRWDDVNMERCEWTIPAADFKTNVEVTVPLVPEVVVILKRRAVVILKQRPLGEWVFPSPKAKGGHLVEPWFWAVELRAKMAELGVSKHWTIHDLRRTCASILTAQGVPLTVVSRAMGHANINMTQVYARADTLGVRAAITAAQGALLGQSTSP